MKKSPFFTVFACMNIAFLFLYIHKVSQCMDCTYRTQELEVEQKNLEQKKQSLMHQVHAAKSHAQVKQFAENTLHMTPINIKQIQRVEV